MSEKKGTVKAIRMKYERDGKTYTWDWPEMTWIEFQQMLLGLMRGGQAIDKVAERERSERGETAVLSMIEADRDAILKAYTLLKTMEKALERKVWPKAERPKGPVQ